MIVEGPPKPWKLSFALMAGVIALALLLSVWFLSRGPTAPGNNATTFGPGWRCEPLPGARGAVMCSRASNLRPSPNGARP